MTKRLFTVRRSISLVVIGLVVFMIGRQLMANWSHLQSTRWQLEPVYLLLAMFFLGIAFVLMAHGWYRIIALIDREPPRLKCYHVYVLSQLGRYIPGKIFMFVGRIVLAKDLGVRSDIASVSVLMEVVLSTAGAFFAALVCYTCSHRIELAWLDPIKTGGLIALGGLCLHPNVVRKGLQILHLLAGTGKRMPLAPFRYTDLLKLSIFYMMVWLMVGIGFGCLLKGILSSEWHIADSPDAACLFLVAWLIGFLSFVTPGGLGVREAILSLGLSQFLPDYLSAVMALAARLWFTFGELMAVAGIVMLLLFHKNYLKKTSGQEIDVCPANVPSQSQTRPSKTN